MGVNISIETLDGVEFYDWDQSRYVGDREIADYIENHCLLTRSVDNELYIKIQNINDLLDEKVMNKFSYPNRFKKLLIILNDHPEYWLYISR